MKNTMQELSTKQRDYIKVSLYNGSIIIGEGDIEKFEQALNLTKFIKFDGKLINTNNVYLVEKYEPTAIEEYLLWIKDPEILKEMETIIKRGREFWREVKSVQDLVERYEKRKANREENEKELKKANLLLDAINKSFTC